MSNPITTNGTFFVATFFFQHHGTGFTENVSMNKTATLSLVLSDHEERNCDVSEETLDIPRVQDGYILKNPPKKMLGDRNESS